LKAAIEKVVTIKPVKKRNNVKKSNSKGAILKEIEKETANLDHWQRQAAIETPDGPQRVRGLAGSGKTVVLAWKAAYLHAQYPEWNIAITFYTRSLYQQFKDLIRRFTFAQSKDEPNWEKLQVIHAWGNRNQAGLYSKIANSIDYPVRDWNYAKTKYGYNQAFEGICNELITIVQNRKISPLYDTILIDEAQDLPISFFKIILPFLTQEQRVVWVYDELQNLTTDYSVPPPEVLFGQDEFGESKVKLANTEGEARQDIILPICYRNTPWALTAAHALGFGIYKQEGLVQLFDDDSLWEDIGYKLTQGTFEPKTKVSLKRKENSYPEFFDRLFSSDESISCNYFENFNQEIDWIVTQILKNLQEDELEYDDILIILPDVITAKDKANQIISVLRGCSIQAHLVGVSSSVDEMFKPDSIAISHIYRAKGNEAPMVYILNAGYCANGLELRKLRNGLFTAITRSRGWVNICGSGEGMKKIKAEFDELKKHKFSLNFTLPDPDARQKLRTINRDRTAAEKAKYNRSIKGTEELFESINKGEIDINSLPPKLIEQMKKIIGEKMLDTSPTKK
ncbi:MAG: ATP-binding domain-containing protein, partial [Candidatus Marithrix sp.]